jgi:signal peptidase I
MMREKIRKFLQNQWIEWRWLILFVVLVLIPIRSSFADWNWVPSGSMNPSILEGDLVYVDKLAYDLRIPLTLHRLKQWSDPDRGDIVVLFSPKDGIRLVKRVIGLPGDEIEMKNNVLFINGNQLSYSELPTDVTKDMMPKLWNHSVFAEEDLMGKKHAVMSLPNVPTNKRSFSKIIVPEDQYFIMGDNRDNSEDSRFFGFAERRLIIGRATSIIASFNKLDKYQPRFARFFTPLN